MITSLRQARYVDTQTPKAKADSPSTVLDSSGEEFNILRVAGKDPAKVQSPAPLPIWSDDTIFTLDSNILPSSSLDSWSSTEDFLSILDSRSSSENPPFSSCPAHMAREGCNESDTPKSDEELDRLLYEASEVITESSKSSESRASVNSKDNHGILVACWQNLIAWICGIIAKVFRRPSNA